MAEGLSCSWVTGGHRVGVYYQARLGIVVVIAHMTELFIKARQFDEHV